LNMIRDKTKAPKALAAIQKAIKAGNLEAVKQLMKDQKPDVHLNSGKTPLLVALTKMRKLHMARLSGRPLPEAEKALFQVIKYLLKTAKADPNNTGLCNCSPLSLGVSCGARVVNLLLKHGADPQKPLEHLRTSISEMEWQASNKGLELSAQKLLAEYKKLLPVLTPQSLLHMLSKLNDTGPHISDVYKFNGALRAALLTHPGLQGAHLSGLDLTHVRLTGVDLRKAALVETTLSHSKLNDMDLGKALLTSTILVSSEIINSNLSQANLVSARLSNTLLQLSNFSGAKMRQIQVQSSTVLASNFSRADLTRAVLSDFRSCSSNFTEANFTRANMSTSSFRGDIFRKANFSSANLISVDLEGADLREANFSGAELMNVNLCGAMLDGIRGLSTTELKDVRIYDSQVETVFSLLFGKDEFESTKPKEPWSALEEAGFVILPVKETMEPARTSYSPAEVIATHEMEGMGSSPATASRATPTASGGPSDTAHDPTMDAMAKFHMGRGGKGETPGPQPPNNKPKPRLLR